MQSMKQKNIKFIAVLLAVLSVAGCTPAPSSYDYRSAPVVKKYAPNPDFIDRVVVKKASGKLYLMRGREIYKEYNIGLGARPRGHKLREGDNKTPEGRYHLTYVNDQSSFYRSFRISYPNERDIMRAQIRGVNPGGDIVIHGTPNSFGPNYNGPMSPRNWTQGCIALSNREMDEIISLVAIDTPIDIYP